MIKRLKNIRSNNVAINAFALFSLRFINMVAPLVVLPYLSRTLGVDGFGLVMFAISACAIGQLFTDYGFDLSATYHISKQRSNVEYVSKLIGAIFTIKLTLLIVFILLMLLYVLLWGGHDKLFLVSYIGLNTLSLVFIPTWFFQGIEKVKNVTLYMIVAKLSYVLMVFLFVHSRDDMNQVILALAMSNAVAASIAIYLIYKNGYSISKPSCEMVVDTFKEGTQFFLSRAAVSMYTSANTFLIGALAGTYQAAIYGASEKIYQASQSVTSSIAQALMPHMARSNDMTMLKKVVFLVTLPLGVGCVVVGIWASDIMALIFGADFYSAGDLLRLFLLLTVINFIGVNFGYPAFAGLNKIHVANYTVMGGACVQLVCVGSLYYLNDISAINILISVLISETVVMCTRFCLYKHYSNG